jgi:predicted alpha/beta hydrolase family esterase
MALGVKRMPFSGTARGARGCGATPKASGDVADFIPGHFRESPKCPKSRQKPRHSERHAYPSPSLGFRSGGPLVMPPTMFPIPVVVLPGSGCTPTRECNFYDWFGRTVDSVEMKNADGSTQKKYRAIMKNMPDPHVCRETAWIPFITTELIGPGEAANTVVVGHSSGAVAAMRLAEKTKLKGIMLVATYDSDMSDANERKSGYFTRDFDWKAIKSNCEFVCCVGGTLDDLVPIQTQRRVAMNCLGLVPNVPKKEWLELPNEDHFFTPPCSELVALLERNVDAVVGSCER